jgi:hypothetical protein
MLKLKIVDFSDGKRFRVSPDLFFVLLQIMLADKQASLEKLEWEVKMSNKKVEDLQGDMSNMGFEISSLMVFFEKISENVSGDSYDDIIPSSYELETLQSMVSMDPWSTIDLSN